MTLGVLASLCVSDPTEGMVTGLIRRLSERIALLRLQRKPSSAAWGKRLWINRAVSGIDDALIAIDLRGRIMFLNEVAESLIGWPLEQAHGRPLKEVFPLVDEQSERPTELIMSGAHPLEATGWVRETAVIARSGRMIPVEYRVAPIVGGTKRVDGSVVLVRDLTGRRRVQEAMAQMAAIVETSDDAIVGVASDGSVMTWNDGSRRRDGDRAEEIVGTPFSLTFPADQAEELAKIRAAMQQGHVIRHQDVVRVARDGSMVEVSVSNSPIQGHEGAIVGFSSIARGIAERKRAEQESRRAELLHKLAEAEERQRQRIAHDLHDQMEQHLAALKFGLEKIMTDTPDRIGLQPLLNLVQQVGRDVRRVALELRPATLDDLGIQDALMNYLGVWSEQSGIEADFHAVGLDATRLPVPTETALYRVVQEALTNVFKHASASRVSVILERRDDHLLAIIEDDGKGFAHDENRARTTPGRGLGLPGMKERITAIGGSLAVETSPGEGTSLFIRVPWDGNEGQA